MLNELSSCLLMLLRTLHPLLLHTPPHDPPSVPISSRHGCLYCISAFMLFPPLFTHFQTMSGLIVKESRWDPRQFLPTPGHKSSSRSCEVTLGPGPLDHSETLDLVAPHGVPP